MNFKACPMTPWSLFRFDRIETGLQIPDLTGFLDANRFPPLLANALVPGKQRISRARHTALLRLISGQPGLDQPNHNITRVIYIHQLI
jgi:hypothetical protein